MKSHAPYAGLPSRARFVVVGLCVGLATVTYLDRVCISTLSGAIMEDLQLSQVQMGIVFSAFALAYAIFEIPSAWMGEKYGTRKTLARIVAWWSLFTMLTATAWNHASLLALRFLFGAGEAGAWPNATRTFSRWIPMAEHGRVQGVFFAGAHLAGGLTPPLIMWLAPMLGWRGVFLACGAIGFVWAALWYRWMRDEPADHPGVNAAELAIITEGRGEVASHHAGAQAGLWRAILTSPHVLGLCVVAFANTYGFYFLITWLPGYLEQVRGFTKSSLALYAGLPLLLSVGADLFGGVTTDALMKRLGLRWGRAVVGICAYLVAAASMFAATQTGSATFCAILIAVAGAASMFTLAAAWSSCIEIGGTHSGLVSATMNTVGQFGAILSPIILAWIVQRSSSWTLPLQIMAGLYLAAALSWCFINPGKKLRMNSAQPAGNFQ